MRHAKGLGKGILKSSVFFITYLVFFLSDDTIMPC